ncbi:MAG: class I tRNA ligase family protein, partial [Elusimicrobiota bacterium]
MDKIMFITTPLYYVNARPHIGHGYTQVAADTLARYYRQKGKKVYLLTGTDEHGEKIFRAAREKNLAPEDFVETGVREFKELWEKLNIKYDRFIRTTEQSHIDTVEKVLSLLYEKGFIYKGSYSGLYCVPCESFYTQSQTEGEKCPDCGRKVRELSQESYFFKLSAFKDRLLEHIDKNPRFIMPESRKNEIKGFLSDTLKDLSISRVDVEWGIQLPFNQKHTVYVWVDALLNYISAPGYISDVDTFKKLWPADMQFIGKDILKFHAVIWPAMLMALDLPLPGTVFAHGWWTVEGNKMSKSLGNVV